MTSRHSGVVALSPDDEAQVEAMAALHLELLPESVPARFGRRFMTRFYFSRLVESGLLAGDLYCHEGTYVGFSAYTMHPDTFLGDGIRRHFLRLCLLMPSVLLEAPRERTRAVRELVAKSGDVRPASPGRTGYWLTFGVQDAYRKLKVDERGSRISKLLVDAMLSRLRAAGIERVDGAVSRENRGAILFYHSCGFRIDDSAGGPDFHIHLDLAAS